MALPEAELAELRDELDALKKNISARCAAVFEARGCSSHANVYEWFEWWQRRNVFAAHIPMQLSMALAQDEEARQLYNRISEVEPRLLYLEFELCNETGFADADGTKAVLNVTSGLKLPTTPLPSVSTAEKIAALIEQDLEIVRKRLIGEEIAKRRRALRGADNARLGHLPPAPGSSPSLAEEAPQLTEAARQAARQAAREAARKQEAEQEAELQRAATAEVEMVRLGLVDAGGTCQHPAGERMLASGHRHGFIAAVTAAFANHYPLILRPQHFWLLISQAVATHIDLNTETVRKNWVAHEGQMTLRVSCDALSLGSSGNNWASVVSGKPDSFAAQIAANTVEAAAKALFPRFSGTTAAEDISQKVVVMGICKKFFSYRCCTSCGFPQITLEGTIEDWQLLREAAERLLTRCEQGFATEWASSLLPVLDKLVAARRGAEIDALFWNSMCKRGGTTGSGAKTWFNGWINIFFPYVDRCGWRPNDYCERYSPTNRYVVPVSNEMDEHTGRLAVGPDCLDFGSGMTQAPVIWEYYGQKIPLDLNAGFTGATQDPETLEITPHVSWFITYTPPEPTRRAPKLAKQAARQAARDSQKLAKKARR